MNNFHANGTAAWDISEELLEFLKSNLKPNMKTLETGAGRSTLTFAAIGCIHQAVTPSLSEVDAIMAAAASQDLSMDQVTFHIGFSQNILPSIFDPAESLNLVLIDGSHAFPIPAVDFQYTAPRIAVGGYLVIDDVDLWTGGMIVDFLYGENSWIHKSTIKGRTAIFQKTAPWIFHEWTKQPAVVAKSRMSQTIRKARNGLGLLFKADFRSISSKLRNERTLAKAAQKDM